jgi:NAD(P)H-hydrate epimerase
MKIVSVAQMKTIEQAANETGITYQAMMEHAGHGVAVWALAHLDLTRGVIGLVGSGNNGGDTLIALTKLAERGFRTFAFLVRPRKNDPLVAAYQTVGGVLINLTEKETLSLLNAALIPGVVLLDGILGTGFHLPLKGSLLKLMTQIQSLVQELSDVQVVAVDCPSGVDCDSGEAAAQCLKADITLTMAAAKQGLLHEPANNLAGQIHLVDIGIGNIEQYVSEPLPTLMDYAIASGLLPRRPETGHKGTFGTCLVLAGTRQYTGAAYLAGKAAYRAGCGLVDVATLPEVRDSLSGRLIEAVWTLLPEKGQAYAKTGVESLRISLERANSIALGPGWGLQGSNQEFLEALLPLLPKDLPTVIDADGLKLLDGIERWWENVPAQTVLTPHPGEMAQMTGLSISEIQANRWKIARKYARKWGVILVLKGALTVIGLPGGELIINPISDSALGTAGSGDVLTGIIGGLLAQGLNTQEAAVLGVWLHGIAGQQAHQCLGVAASVTALDILDALPATIGKIKRPA